MSRSTINGTSLTELGVSMHKCNIFDGYNLVEEKKAQMERYSWCLLRYHGYVS